MVMGVFGTSFAGFGLDERAKSQMDQKNDISGVVSSSFFVIHCLLCLTARRVVTRRVLV